MSYLANMNIPKLTDEEKLSCEGKLTKNESWNALSFMGSNKAWGTMVCLKSSISAFLMKFITIF